MQPQQGDRLGRYEILAQLGAGGMGEVFRARDTELGRDVAVKVIPHAVADDEARLARFEGEARAVAALSHPNILQIYDVGSDKGVRYLVTELLEGQTLRDRVAPPGLPWPKVVEYGAAIAGGLAAAHGKGVVHRDVKPENVFITADDRVKLLDFGLARVEEEIAPEGETATLTPAGTQAGTILGTVGYMAPEQVTGKVADARSDIFALGCVLFEMVSGRRAFAGQTGVEIMAAILKEEPPPLSTTGVVLPTDLERVIQRCLEKSPDARFQSAADLAYALRSIGSGTAPVMATAEADVEPRAWVRRRRVAVVWAVVVLAAVGYVGWQGLALRTDRPARSSEEAQPPAMAASGQVASPFVDEWKVRVAGFENRTGDPSLDPVGAIVADRLVDGMARLTRGLQVLPAVTVATAETSARDVVGRESSSTTDRGRILVTGTYSTREGDLEVVARVRGGDGGGVLYATDAHVIPRQPHSDDLQPLVETVMGAVGTHVFEGLANVSHVPDHAVFHAYLVGWEEKLSGSGGGGESIERALSRDPEYLSPAFYLAGTRLWAGHRDGAFPYLDHIRQRSHRLTQFESLWLEMLEAWSDDASGRALRAARAMEELAPASIMVRFYRTKFAWDLNRPNEVASTLAGIVDRIPGSLGWLRGYMRLALRAAYESLGDYDELLELARQMRREAPGDTAAFEVEAAALGGLGRLEEVDALVDQCRSIPGGECTVQGVLMSASAHLAVVGYRTESIEYARRAVDVVQRLPDGDPMKDPSFQLLALRRAEMWGEYAAIANRAAEEAGTGPDADMYFLCCVGMAAAHDGDPDTAESVIERLVSRGELTYAAYVTGYLGDLERATEYFRRGIELHRGVTYRSVYRWDPDIEPLWGHEPFRELMMPRG